jgi:hypothetical protein
MVHLHRVLLLHSKRIPVYPAAMVGYAGIFPIHFEGLTMAKIETISVDGVAWEIFPGAPNVDDFKYAYCADGDGMVQVVEHASGQYRFELLDQLEHCAYFDNLADALADATKYLAAQYRDIYLQHRPDMSE